MKLHVPFWYIRSWLLIRLYKNFEVGLDGLQDFINIIVIQDCSKQGQINVMHKSGLFQTNLLKNKFKQFEFLTGSCWR